MKRILWVVFSLFAIASCGTKLPAVEPDGPQGDTTAVNPGQADTTQVDPLPQEPVRYEKDRSLWVGVSSNWSSLATKGDIKTWITKIKNAGFNEIILEVKPMEGGVMYPSDLLPTRSSYKGITRNYDYVDYFVNQCKTQGIKIGAAVTVFPTSGLGETSKYKDSTFENCYSQEILTGAEITDIRNNHTEGIFPFLNPADPLVRQFVMELCEEVVTKYDFDSFTLDYCRYQNYYSDFSATSRSEFEKYIGTSVKNWPQDVYYHDASGAEVFGEYFKQWIEWRSSVITGYVKEIGERIHAIRPNIKFEYWAASWWPLWGTGQNWSSSSVNVTKTYWWATENYYKTGFAEYLDAFQDGAYNNYLTPEYNSNTVSYSLLAGKNLVKGKCAFHGSFSVSSGIKFDPGDAAYWCLKNTDGVMVFEMSHMIAGSYWTSIKAGFDKAIADGSAYYTKD